MHWTISSHCCSAADDALETLGERRPVEARVPEGRRTGVGESGPLGVTGLERLGDAEFR